MSDDKHHDPWSSEHGDESWRSRRPTGLLARIATAQATHPKRTVFGGLGFFVLIMFLALGPLKGTLENKFVIPGSDVQSATDVLKDRFGARNGAVLQIVMNAQEGQRLDGAAQKAAITAALAEAKKADSATDVKSPFDDKNQRYSTTDPRIGYAEVQFSKDGFQLKRNDVLDLEKQITDTLAAAGIQTEYTGDAEQAPPEQGASELIGFAVALLVLLIVFRTLVAAAVPIVFALISVGTAFGLLFLLANLTDFNTITPILISMIGIGVGIDYTLFIVTRFRQALHDGMPPQLAAAYASSTAGRAVIFAGVTVAISITGLAVIGIPFITKLGMGGALGVLTAVGYATFLLPGLLAMLGHKIDRLKVPFLKEADESEAAQERSWLGRWGRFTTSHPGATLIVSGIVLLVLAAPVLATRLGTADAVDGAEELDDPQGLRPAGAGLRRRASTARSRSSSSQNGDAQAAQKVYDAAKTLPKSDVAFVQAADPERQEGRRPRDDLADHGAAGGRDGRPHHPAPRHDRPGRAHRQRRAGLRERPERRVHRHRRPHLLADAVVPAVHHRRHVHRAGDGVPVGRDRDQGRDHDAHLGHRRVRRADLGREDGQRPRR